ncbi:MAG: DUF1153 domain-containing protein [Planktomarina sp.]
MYLKKIDGPRAVQLPNGSHMSRAELPPVNTTRWVASRKAAVVKAVAAHLISRSDACLMYGISQEELVEWCAAVQSYGEKALRTTALQKYRQPKDA